MINLETREVIDLFRELHPDLKYGNTVTLLSCFNRWEQLTVSIGMLGRCHWWFWDSNPKLATFIRDEKPSITVAEAAKRLLLLKEKVAAIDSGFVTKVHQISECIGRGEVLPPPILVRGRNPLFSPSVIEGNHRCLAIWIAYLNNQISSNSQHKIILGRKSFLGI